MLTLLLHYRTEWSYYFTETNPTKYNSQTYTSRPTLSGSNVYISNCLFISITSTSDGGALYLYNSVTNFLVESTSFFTCKTTGGSWGGAIYFSNSGGGQSVLHEVCAYDCCSNMHCLFARIEVSDTASSKNYFNYSSISRCVSTISGSNYPLCLWYGKVCCPSVNISMNKCYYRSGIYCYPSIDSNSVVCSFTYSSFADNTAIGYTCIFIWMEGQKYEIKSCNILRNTQPIGNGEGIIYTNGNLMIEDSCILENKGTYIFRQDSSSYTITLSNCTVDLTSNNGYLTTKNTVTKSFILALNHMSTRNCHSEYDSAGTLTPIIQTPSSSKKQINCYTFVNFIYQCRLSDFFSFSSIFLFNFIHSDTSN
jgi:hypothetical protein